MSEPVPAATCWRPVTTVLCFAALPFATFLHSNRGEASLDGAIVLYALAAALPGLAAVALARRRWGARAGEAAAVVYAAGAFVLFKFEAVRDGVELAGAPADRPVIAGIVWAALLAAVVWGALRLGRSPRAWSYALVVGVALTALPAAQYTAYELGGDQTAEARTTAVPAGLIEAAREGPRPDVYLFVFDGYGRADQLHGVLGLDNGPFLRELGDRGFDVDGRALSSYTVTYLSIASLFAMDHPVTAGRIKGRGPFKRIVERDNPAVSAFRAAGYDYAFFGTEVDFNCGKHVDLCIRSGNALERRLGEREWALLDTTPLGQALPRLGINRPHDGTASLMLSPVDVVDEVARRRGDAPVLVYSHHLLPHPPYRYGEDCSPRSPDAGSFEEWGDPEGEGARLYAATTTCANREILAAVDRILERDPDAVILLLSDHGPGFGIPFEDPAERWSRDDLLQRFGILSAIRTPDGCRNRAPDAPANAFRAALSCVAGAELAPVAPRHFAVGYGESAPVTEVPRERFGG